MSAKASQDGGETACDRCGDPVTHPFRDLPTQPHRVMVGPIDETMCYDCADEHASLVVLTYIREGVIRSADGAREAYYEEMNQMRALAK